MGALTEPLQCKLHHCWLHPCDAYTEIDSSLQCSILFGDSTAVKIHYHDKTAPFVFQDENLLLQFHISNLEYACGCDLGQASALHWDQNEAFPQFTGVHSMISEGYSAVLERLSQGLDVRLNTVVGYFSS